MKIRSALLAICLLAPLGALQPALAQAPLPPTAPGIGSFELAQRLTPEDRFMRREQRRAQRQAIRPQCRAQAQAQGLRGPMNREARRAYIRQCVRSRVT